MLLKIDIYILSLMKDILTDTLNVTICMKKTEIINLSPYNL